jgi:hypothetical protein
MNPQWKHEIVPTGLNVKFGKKKKEVPTEEDLQMEPRI